MKDIIETICIQIMLLLICFVIMLSILSCSKFEKSLFKQIPGAKNIISMDLKYQNQSQGPWWSIDISYGEDGELMRFNGEGKTLEDSIKNIKLKFDEHTLLDNYVVFGILPYII